LGFAASLAAQTLPETSAPVQLSIQYHDQHIYYEHDDVMVKLTINNNSAEVYRFRLADQRMFSVDFGVQNLANQSAVPSERYSTVLSDNKPIFTRDISILPGESYAFVEKLNDYKQLAAGMHVITAYLYPELRYAQATVPLVSNRMSLDVRPDIRRQRALEETTAKQVQQILKAQSLAPDQVVEYMLNARMKNLREAYFLYLNMEKIYGLEPRRAEAFRRMSEMDRMSAIDKYKELIWMQKTTDNISMVPINFQILKTSYDPASAQVEVVQKYRTKDMFFTEIKLYRYKLEKQDGIWYITDYSVTNKGNE